MSLLPLLAALGLGLVSTLHCWGMCGGIVGAFSAALPGPSSKRGPGALRAIMVFNLGRVSSYVLAGFAAGALGATLLAAAPIPGAYLALQILAGVLLCLIGLNLGGWLPRWNRLEQLGIPLWERLRGALRWFLPMDNPAKAFCAGAIWGWIPCGLVYSTLAWSATAANPLHSAALMLAFGVGTLPGMVAAGSALRSFSAGARLRKTFAIVLVLAGLVYLAMHLGSAAGTGHHTHGPGLDLFDSSEH